MLSARVRVKCEARGARRVKCEGACEAARDWWAINRFPRSLPTILSERAVVLRSARRARRARRHERHSTHRDARRRTPRSSQ